MTNIITILIVEDELLIARSLSNKLQKLGYTIVDIVSSGEKAIKVAGETKPDLVLMDIVIQGEMDGITAAATIYKKYNIPVIYLTAYTDEETLSRAEQTGCYGYIVKPFKDQEVNAMIKMAISKHRNDSQVLGLLNTAENISKELNKMIKTATMRMGLSEKLDLETDIYHALVNQELELYYQPRVNLKTAQISGAEALIRWYHPKRGRVSPDIFIPIAEEVGIIHAIGDWVLQTACQQTKNWHQQGMENLKISVNISGKQFNQPDFEEKIIKVLNTTGIKPENLELELTESILISEIEKASQKMTALKLLGINIAIDDFGKGYSSLSYLHKLPFDTLKIDRSFVENIDINNKNKSILAAILQMTNQLNLAVVAEGVERQEELEILYKLNCDEIQGYIFSPPLPHLKFEELISNGLQTNLLDH